APAPASRPSEAFRPGTGPPRAWPGWYGLTSAQPHLLRQPGPARTLSALHAWHVLGLGSRFLALNDVSGAMNVRVSPGGPTLEQVLGSTSAAGVTRFPDSNRIGLWVFTSHLQGVIPYKELVPMGPLPRQARGGTRRQAIPALRPPRRALP